MAAFKDPKKLADAIALARSFKKGDLKDAKQHSKPKPKSVSVADKVEKYDLVGRVPPSQRQYSSNALKTGWQIDCVNNEAVIGKSVFDFLTRQDPEPAPAATPKPANVPPNTQPTANLASPRSPMMAAASTPLTPGSLIQESQGDQTSPEDSPQNGIDKYNDDQLAKLLKSFSFKDTKPSGDPTEDFLQKFLAVLATKSKISHILDEYDQLRNNDATVITKSDERKHLSQEYSPDQQYQPPQKSTQQTGTTESVVATTEKGKKLCPRALDFVPSKPELANDRTDKLHPAVAPLSDQNQGQLPFTGQFSKASDDTSEGYWPVTEKVSPGAPLTYTIWVPVQYPVPDAYNAGVMAANGDQGATSRVNGSQPQPIRGLSASRWANQPPAQSE